MQHLHLRHCLEQVPSTAGEERSAQVANLETSRGDQGIGYN